MIRWLSAVLFYVGAGLIGGCAVSTAPSYSPVPTGDATISVIARGWHTDIGLSVDEVTGPLKTLERNHPGVRFMVFGFGERNYFMDEGAGSGGMLTALFPSKSAILLTALLAPPTEAFADEQVVTLRLPQDVVDRVADLLWQALDKTADGSAHRLADGPHPGSTFYAANETYHAFYTCNTWTALLLRRAGLPIDPEGVLFTGQVMRQVSRIAALQRQ